MELKARKWARIDAVLVIPFILIFVFLFFMGFGFLSSFTAELGFGLMQTLFAWLFGSSFNQTLVGFLGGALGFMTPTTILMGTLGMARLWRNRHPEITGIISTSADMAVWFTSDMPHSETEYLRNASCRVYLGAVLSSAVPRLMKGDVDMMEWYFNKEKTQERLEKEQREAAVEEHARQIANINRMENFAKALSKQKA